MSSLGDFAEQAMRCLSIEETTRLFGPLGYSVSLNEVCYRHALRLREDISARQLRIAASPPNDPRGLNYFMAEANRWLPTDAARLLWIDHWQTNGPDSAALVEAARRGLGDPRPLKEAPGHLFDAHPYGEADQAEMTPAHSHELGFLVGVASQIVLSGSDGWLIADAGHDRIEFWEGNILFHSEHVDRLREAERILEASGCSRSMK